MAKPNLTPPTLSEIDIARFKSKIDRRGPDDCWDWKASGLRGYGQFHAGHRRFNATRIAYYLHHRRWPTLLICHSCDRPSCCNPLHLFEATQKENMADCIAKNRIGPRARGDNHWTVTNPRLKMIGENHTKAKLDNERVRMMRSEYESGRFYQFELAKKYGVDQSVVSEIVRRKTWRHVP